jgi:hypothetical protein
LRQVITVAVSTAINRPTVHMIYPPVAGGAFAAIRVVSFGGHGQHLRS